MDPTQADHFVGLEDLDQVGYFVGPGLEPNCLQRLYQQTNIIGNVGIIQIPTLLS